MKQNNQGKEQKRIRITVAGSVILLLLLIVFAVIGSMNRLKDKEALRDPMEKEQLQDSFENLEENNEAKEAEDLENIQEQESEEKQEGYVRIKVSRHGLTYTPYASSAKWKTLSEEEKAEMTEELIPVREDKNKTIERICTCRTNEKVEPYSYTLASFLRTFCRDQGIAATEGAFLAYAGWISEDEEDVYIVLNDPQETVLLARAIDQGRTWRFEIMEGTRNEVLQEAQKNEERADELPAEAAKEKTEQEEE